MIDRETLNDLYVNEKLSIRKIAKLLEYSASGIRYWLETYCIKIRSKSEAQTGCLNHQYNKKGQAHCRFGKKHSEEQKKHWSKMKSGSGNPMYGHERNDLRKKFLGNGNPFWNKKHSEETRKKMRHEITISPLYMAIRKLAEYKEWRTACFIRDKHKCILCGKNRPIQVDHIKQFALIIKEYNVKTTEEAIKCSELWNINNGRTLCEMCHLKTETYGKKINAKS